MSTNSNTQANGGGSGVAGTLFLVFLVLKLTHLIDWSWWWVTAPLWISAVIVAVFLGGVGVAILALRKLPRRSPR